MNRFNKKILPLIYLIIITHNIIIVQSYVEFINENDTDILYDLKNAFFSIQDTTFDDGSGTSPSKIIRNFFI
jgi:hypothetical protein